MKKRHLFYTLWFFAALIFFLYRLFPGEEVRKYIEYRITNAGSGYTLQIGEVRPDLRAGLRLYDAEIHRQNNVMIKAEEVKLMPGFLSLFSSSPAVRFDAMLCGGTAEGTVTLSRASAEKKADAVLSGIQIKQIQALQNASAYPVSGILEGTVTYAEDTSGAKGNADLTVRNLTADLGTGFLTVGKLTFAEITAKMELENPQNLQIRECTAKGNQIGGNLAGTVGLTQPVEKSVLNLTGTIRPHPSLIAQMGDAMASLVFKSGRAKGEFPFKIRGTLEKPEFSMQ